MLVVFLSHWFECANALMIRTVVHTTYPRYRRACLAALGGFPPGRILGPDSELAGRVVANWIAVLIGLNYEAVFIEDSGAAIIWIGDDVIDVHTNVSSRGRRLRRTLFLLGMTGPYGKGRESFVPVDAG